MIVIPCYVTFLVDIQIDEWSRLYYVDNLDGTRVQL